jgi:hypothetical protein
MTITYTAPILTPDLTKKRLVRFAADPVARRILCMYEIGYLNGGGAFVVVDKSERLFTDESSPTFAQFVSNCPAAGPLRNQIETYETTLDRAGTVD